MQKEVVEEAEVVDVVVEEEETATEAREEEKETMTTTATVTTARTTARATTTTVVGEDENEVTKWVLDEEDEEDIGEEDKEEEENDDEEEEEEEGGGGGRRRTEEMDGVLGNDGERPRGYDTPASPATLMITRDGDRFRYWRRTRRVAVTADTVGEHGNDDERPRGYDTPASASPSTIMILRDGNRVTYWRSRRQVAVRVRIGRELGNEERPRGYDTPSPSTPPRTRIVTTGGERVSCSSRRRRLVVTAFASALLALAIGTTPSAAHRPAPNYPIILQSSTSTTATPWSVYSGNGTVLSNGANNNNEFDPDAEDGYNASIHHHHHKKIGGNMTEEKAPLFPEDLFTVHERRRGAVILHVIGVVYMFVALAIVCDEFFVPSLDVIIEKLEIADDVAGATFMAAGGSAPELFTSIIGVFVSFDDVGIGTIVGSAVFNILFVIGMCAIFSRTVLSLTWWPLFRDCTFYSASLITLIYFFRDNYIHWYEALVLFGFYLAYVSFMKWNQPMEKFAKRVVYRNKVTRVRSTDQLMPSHQSAAQALHPNATNSSETSVGGVSGACGSSGIPAGGEAGCSSRGGSSSGAGGTTGQSCEQGAHGGPSSHSRESHAKFRHGLLQLMIHTIDPLHDGKVDEKATQLHAIASLKALLDATRPHNGAATSTAAHYSGAASKETTLQLQQGSQGTTTTTTTTTTAGTTAGIQELPNGGIAAGLDAGLESGEEDEPPEALDMGWPSSPRKRLTYILVAPILFPLWLTLPDTRTPRGKKLFAVTFIGSIFWIAAYSYLMVWWANVAGDTVRIPPEVMGLTFLAAGTSIPDLITSVIVARKGFGDMAVSSSVGSNIFDVTVGLPVPWLLYGLIYGKPVEVNSVGMVCSIAILFCMLLFVIMSIACFKWRMNKGLGFTMFLLYFVFVAVSLMFEYEFLVCPA